ncbi:HEAT repeat domain-containing protein [Thermococcus sp.]
MLSLAFLAVLKGGDIIVDRDGLRKDLIAWHLTDVRRLAEEYDRAFEILLELLRDENPHVRANAVQVLMDMLSGGKLTGKKKELALDSVLELVKDKDERVALKALEFINALLETGELSEEEYERVTDALKEVIKSGVPVISEYAAEGLGKLGAKVAKIAYRIIRWLFSLIGSSRKREVQGAAITALTEMAMKTEDRKVLNEIFEGVSDLLSHPDPYVVERALYSLERMLSREREISTRNKLKAITRIKSLRGDVKLGVKASQVLEKLEKSTTPGETALGEIESKKAIEVSQYTIDDVERLLDAGKTEIVAEMARLDPEVMDKVLNMLESEDYSRRLDALWIVARLTSHLTPSDAYRILPVLGDFLKSRNPWARETAAKVLADIYALYPGTSKFFSSLLDTLLRSGKEKDVEGALELMARLSDRVSSREMLSGMLKLILKLLDDGRTRGVTLRALAREAQKLLDIDTEDLFALEDKLKEIYGKEGGKYDEIIAGLIDVIDDILKMRRQGIVVNG